MSDLRTAAQQALEALEFMADEWGFTQKANRPERWQAIEALRAALEQPDWTHLKRYGYAPGDYMSRCCRCGESVSGLDKRAVTCKPCAEARHAFEQASAMEQKREQPEQEPVYWEYKHVDDGLERWNRVVPRTGQTLETAAAEIHGYRRGLKRPYEVRALYTAPPRREWRGLSEEEFGYIYVRSATHEEFARAIEAALRSKNYD